MLPSNKLTLKTNSENKLRFHTGIIYYVKTEFQNLLVKNEAEYKDFIMKQFENFVVLSFFFGSIVNRVFSGLLRFIVAHVFYLNPKYFEFVIYFLMSQRLNLRCILLLVASGKCRCMRQSRAE